MKATDCFTRHVRRTGLALVGCFLCAAVCLAQSAPAKILVDDVVPQGYHTVPSQRIISLLKTRPGGEFNQEVVNEDVRRLYETRLFANIRVHTQQTPDNKIKVYFIVAEYPSTIQDVEYRGAKHLKKDELDTITGLRKGAPLNPITNQMARQSILRRYNDVGRLWAGVELVEGDKPGDTKVVFNITEGKVVRVSKIEFMGNSFVSGARLNTQVKSSHQFLGLFGGTFDPVMADHDVALLEEYYKSNGFHKVRVSREFEWDVEAPEHVKLIFHISEGERYRIATTQVDGNKIFSQDQLLERSKLRPGEFYNKGQVDVDTQTIQAIYGFKGYPVTVREENFYPAPGQVAVHYQVQEQPAAKVGQIYFVGNEVTRDNVIRRQIPLYPGQTLTYPDMRVAERNLAKLQIFEVNPSTGVRPTVSIIDPDVPNEFKDLLVTVQEQPTGSLMFGVGVNSDAGLVGTIALNERNFDITRWPTSFDDLLSMRAFRGAGQEFRAEAMPGTQLQRYSMSFREPYLFDSQYSLQVSGYYYNQAFNEYTESRLGTRLTLGRQWNRFWSTSLTVRAEEVGVHNVPYYEPEEIQRDIGDHFLVGVRGSVARDSRDSYLRATEGSRVELSFEQVLGDYTFPKMDLEATKFWTVYQRADGSGRHVLAARSEVAWTGSHTPVFERFYAGGYRSMRGFEFRGVGPAVNGFFIGGDFMFLNSLEYQIPILANDQLWAVAFLDTGTVERSVEIKDYRAVVGAGLRITVPMLGPVPIALDLGFPINKGPSDKEQVFSFWVGFFH